jgi:hypothetical protein
MNFATIATFVSNAGPAAFAINKTGKGALTGSLLEVRPPSRKTKAVPLMFRKRMPRSTAYYSWAATLPPTKSIATWQNRN